MATSQEWIIDQKKEFFQKSRQRKKSSKDLFRKRSDSAIRFRSYDSHPLGHWSKMVRFHKNLISYKMLWWIGYFARMSEVGSNDRNMTLDYRQFCKMLPISQSLHVTLHHHVINGKQNFLRPYAYFPHPRKFLNRTSLLMCDRNKFFWL